MISQHIFFTGFMGSGKSMIGKRLSDLTHSPFVDIDDLIVEQERMSVKAIFTQRGEAYFRAQETAWIERIGIRSEPHVIALGGGAICSQRNVDILKRSGIIVYLKVSLDLLIDRLMRNQKRPLLLDESGQLKSKDEIRKIVSELLEKRKIWYEKADICIEINQAMEKEDVTSFVAEQLKSFIS